MQSCNAGSDKKHFGWCTLFDSLVPYKQAQMCAEGCEGGHLLVIF